MTKFVTGDRVKIADDLGQGMDHFPSGCLATVIEADDVEGSNEYYLEVDGHGPTAWYYEHQLTAAGESV